MCFVLTRVFCGVFGESPCHLYFEGGDHGVRGERRSASSCTAQCSIDYLKPVVLKYYVVSTRMKREGVEC